MTSLAHNVTGTGTAVASGASGMLDTSFHTDGKWDADIASGGNQYMYAIASYANDAVVIAGADVGSAEDLVSRVTADDVLDTSFASRGWFSAPIGGLGNRAVWDVAIQTNGRIVLGEGASSTATDNYVRIIRMLSDSSLDTTFFTTSSVRSIAKERKTKIGLHTLKSRRN